MILWRITKRAYSATPLDGEGSRRFGSRWNHPGVRIASTSATLSLAVLEYIVHVDPDVLPADLVSVNVIVPQTIVPKVLDVSALPRNWRDYPAPENLADVGDAWQRRGESLLLRIPSAIVPEEDNILVNPEHPDFSRVRVGEVKAFAFDPRLFARGR